MELFKCGISGNTFPQVKTPNIKDIISWEIAVTGYFLAVTTIHRVPFAIVHPHIDNFHYSR